MEINNYMDLIQVKYKHSSWQLFKGYLRGVKPALANNDLEQFILYRKGYEVLRDQESFEAYHKIYRKYILREKLNYPTAKEMQLIEQFRIKEKKAEKYVESNLNQLPSFNSYLSSELLNFIGFDLLRIIGFGRSGFLFCGIGMWAMLHFQNSVNILGGALAVLFGIFFFKRNFKFFVSG